jgi:hypothetical protein
VWSRKQSTSSKGGRNEVKNLYRNRRHQRDQNTPLLGYALDICNSAYQPSIPDYYIRVSAGKFIINTQAWHNNGKCYVMQGFWTPTNAIDPKHDFGDSLITRIDRENVWSFANNAMWWPNNDNPAASDTPFTWIFIVWPEPYGGGWGQAPDGQIWQVWYIPTGDSLYNPASHTYKKVYANIFGVSRQPSTHAGDATAGIVHEINHQWCPDIGYDPDNYALGGFDPQCAGMGFWDEQSGGLPSPLNPKWRYELGWINKVTLSNEPGRVFQDQTKDTVYFSDQWLISTHRRQSYYESNWPGRGMLIWHIKGFVSSPYEEEPAWWLFETGEDTFSYLKKGIDLECAHGRWNWNGFTHTTPDPVKGRDNLDKMGYYSLARGYHGVGDADCFFNPNYGYQQFDGLTNPSYVSSSDTLGVCLPQNVAIRNIQFLGKTAMRADLICNYCIASTSPQGSIQGGANSQRAVATASSWLDEWGKYRFHYALSFIEDDSLWVRISEDFSRLGDAERQLVCAGSSPKAHSAFSHGRNDK